MTGTYQAMKRSMKYSLGVIATLALLNTSCTTTAESPGANVNEQRKIRTVSNNNRSQKVVTRQTSKNDRLGNLIRESEQAYQSDRLTIEQNTSIRPYGGPSSPKYGQPSNFGETNYNYVQWVNASAYRANEVAQYKRYLANYLGDKAVPPFDQLLTTARSWESCGYEQYQLPPYELWSNMVSTLRLYDDLKKQGVLPPTAEIRSTYRSPSLNACAGGAPASKHMSNGAIDIWVPEYEGQPWEKSSMQERLCQFWSSQGERYSFGLGLYATGAIHLDTQGYRYWGAGNSDPGSYCRYLN